MGLAMKFFGMAVEVFIISTVLTEAFKLISAKSDAAVTQGFLLLVFTMAVAIASLFFWFPGLRKLLDHEK